MRDVDWVVMVCTEPRFVTASDGLKLTAPFDVG
jgi:hypothetical protein